MLFCNFAFVFFFVFSLLIVFNSNFPLDALSLALSVSPIHKLKLKVYVLNGIVCVHSLEFLENPVTFSISITKAPSLKIFFFCLSLFLPCTIPEGTCLFNVVGHALVQKHCMVMPGAGMGGGGGGGV